MKETPKSNFSAELESLTLDSDSPKIDASLYGNIQAGFPSSSNDFLMERISLEELYLSKTQSTFIMRSDYNLQHQDDIVVSVNASDYTLKRYDKHNRKRVALDPCYNNSIQLSEGHEVIMLGVVNTLIRERKR